MSATRLGNANYERAPGILAGIHAAHSNHPRFSASREGDFNVYCGHGGQAEVHRCIVLRVVP